MIATTAKAAVVRDRAVIIGDDHVDDVATGTRRDAKVAGRVYDEYTR